MKKTTLVAFCMALAAITNAGELMTERCSGMVAIVPSYDDMPNTSGTVILRRGTNGFSGWRHLTVKLNPDGYIRWWCQPEGKDGRRSDPVVGTGQPKSVRGLVHGASFRLSALAIKITVQWPNQSWYH